MKWNNNTCNKHGDPYDKKIETTQTCVTVICTHDRNVYDDHANMKCSSLCSDMPRIHVTRITIHYITVSVGFAYEITIVPCHSICVTCIGNNSGQCLLSCTVNYSIRVAISMRSINICRNSGRRCLIVTVSSMHV